MDAQRILRIPRSDDPESFVLVNVVQTGKSGLDVKLVATEGEDPYVGSMRQSRLKNLRAKNYQGSEEEWADILSYVFVPSERPHHPQRDWESGLEVVATVKEEDDDEKELIITLRKRIDAITQRLGSITLKQDDDQAIQLFEWNGIAVARANTLETQISSLTDKYRLAEQTIAKLNSQLEDLIQAKNDHDDQLIAKFVQLLNEKKLKIRNQQRVLASAKIDPNKVAELDAASEGRDHTAGSSRKGKRKAAKEEPAESEESDGFDRMSVDGGKPEGAGESDEAALATDSDRQSTPEPLEDETPTADEGDDEDQEPRTLQGRKGIRRVSDDAKKADDQCGEEPRQTRSGRSTAATQQPQSKQAQAKKTASPPPRRELPFSRRRAAGAGSENRSQSSTPATGEPDKTSSQPEPKQAVEENDGEETGGETDDDEL